ncbi:MAG: threonyl-tRNA synthetase, partial [Actinomycetota bacterium]|nr:threonyl-tRNA synthetase [Actinomycetota bacterium]
MSTLTLPDGSTKMLPEGEPVGGVVPKGTLAARVDGVLRDLSFVPQGDVSVIPVGANDEDGLHVLRHSTAHVLAQAVCDVFPGAKYAIGPAIADGFYYDFALPDAIAAADLQKIDRRMRQIIKSNQPFVREEVSRQAALERLADQPFKLEIIEGLEEAADEIGAGDTVSIYRNGDWADLCLGPHVPSTGKLGVFKVTNL